MLTTLQQAGTYQGNLNGWLMRNHYTYWVAYQPYSHRVWFELARNGILVAVAALAILVSVWWLRIRPAERCLSTPPLLVR